MGLGGQCSQAVKGSAGVAGGTGLWETWGSWEPWGRVSPSRLAGLRVLNLWLVGPQAGAQESWGADRGHADWGYKAARATGSQERLSSGTCEEKKEQSQHS